MKECVLSLMLSVLFLICGCGASLVFVSDRDGRDQIYSMASNGFNQQNLSNNSAYEHFSDISPDAAKIVFSSFRNPPGENIYIMDLDGQNVQQVTTGTGQRTRPRWAPNGLIAFAHPAYTQGARIWTIRSDGSGLAAVTSPGPNESDDSGHDFFDAGRMIAFSRYDGTTQDTIPGIGKLRKAQLLAHFGSFEALRAATLVELSAPPGFNLKLAATIQASLDATSTAQAAE